MLRGQFVWRHKAPEPPWNLKNGLLGRINTSTQPACHQHLNITLGNVCTEKFKTEEIESTSVVALICCPATVHQQVFYEKEVRRH